MFRLWPRVLVPSSTRPPRVQVWHDMSNPFHVRVVFSWPPSGQDTQWQEPFHRPVHVSVACAPPPYLALNVMQSLLHLAGSVAVLRDISFLPRVRSRQWTHDRQLLSCAVQCRQRLKVIPLLDIGKSVVEVELLIPAHLTINITPPLCSFHYHVGNVGSLSSSSVSALIESSFSPGDCRIMNNPAQEVRTFIDSFTRHSALALAFATHTPLSSQIPRSHAHRHARNSEFEVIEVTSPLAVAHPHPRSLRPWPPSPTCSLGGDGGATP